MARLLRVTQRLAPTDGAGGNGDAVGVHVRGDDGVGEVHLPQAKGVGGGAGRLARGAADVQPHPDRLHVAPVELGDGEARGDGLAGGVVGAVGGGGGDADADLREGRRGGCGAGQRQGEGGASGERPGAARGAGGAAVMPEAGRRSAVPAGRRGAGGGAVGVGGPFAPRAAFASTGPWGRVRSCRQPRSLREGGEGHGRGGATHGVGLRRGGAAHGARLRRGGATHH